MITIFLSLFSATNIADGKWESLLNSNQIYDMILVDEGAWCATNGGVRFFSTQDSSFTRSFTNVQGLPHNTCRALAQCETGELWVATDAGAAVISVESGGVEHYPGLDDSIVSVAVKGDTVAVATKNGIYIIRMLETPLNSEDDDVFFFTPDSVPKYSPRKLCWFDGSWWVALSGGLLRYNPGVNTSQWFSTASGLPSSDVIDLDNRSAFVALTTLGVARYDTASETFLEIFSFDTPLPIVSSVAQKNDTFYVASTAISGSYKSLFRYRELADTLDTIGFWVDIPQGTKSDWKRSAQVVKIDKTGHVWVGLGANPYFGNGLVVWNEKSRNYEGFDCPGLNSNYVFYVLLDDHENLFSTHWLSWYEHGVTRIKDGDYENFISYVLDSQDTISFDGSTKIAVSDSKGRIVFGGWWGKKGIFRYDPSLGKWENYSFGSEILNRVACLGVDGKDRIWVSPFIQKQFRVLSADLDELSVIPWPYDHVWDIEFDSNTLWIATSVGLATYRPQDFNNNLEDGEVKLVFQTNSKVSSITLDGKGGVWGATNEGAFHWTPNDTSWLTTSNSRLPENELVAVDRDQWGRVFFLCKHQGVAVYDPAGIAYDTSSSLWQLITPGNSKLINGFDYTWLDVDRTGRVAVSTAGGGVSLLTLPTYIDTTSISVSVYPNPNYLSLGLPVRFTPLTDAQSVTVYTLSGERKAYITADKFLKIQGVLQAEMDVREMAAGIYLAVIKFPNRVERLKFVLVK